MSRSDPIRDFAVALAANLRKRAAEARPKPDDTDEERLAAAIRADTLDDVAGAVQDAAEGAVAPRRYSRSR